MKNRNVIIWGFLHSLGYFAVTVGFGIAAAPCTAGCLSVAAMAASGDGPNPVALGFFGTIAVVGFVNGIGAARRHNASVSHSS